MFKTKVGKVLLPLAALFTTSAAALPADAAEQYLYIAKDFTGYQELEHKYEAAGPTLLYSDSPEMVYQDGILYRDRVDGEVRLFFHHVNAVAGKKRLAIILKNNASLHPVHYAITRQGVAGKTSDWLLDGKNAEKYYFGKQKQNPEGSVGFSKSVELLNGKGVVLNKDELLTGILDLKLDRPAELSILMCDVGKNVFGFNDNGKILPLDEHPLRGTFKAADWNFNLKHSLQLGPNEYKMLHLASAEKGFIKGVDATTGLAAEDYGNYGVVYNVDFSVSGKHKVQFILDPIGGTFAGYGVLENKKTGKQQLLALPKHATSFASVETEAMELATLGKGDYRFTWSPPGASNLPVRLFWKGIPTAKEAQELAEAEKIANRHPLRREWWKLAEEAQHD